MAQPLHCDYTDCPALADVLVSRTATGETLAWCDEHYLVMCEAIVAAVAEAAAGRTPTDLPNPIVTDAVDHLVDEAAVSAAADRMDALPPAADRFPTSDATSPAVTPPPEPPTKPASGSAGGRQGRNSPDGAIAAPEAALAPTDEPGGPLDPA